MSVLGTNCNFSSTRCGPLQRNNQDIQLESPNLCIGSNLNNGSTLQQVSRQPYYSNLSYHDYQGPNIKGIYLVNDNNKFGSYPEDFYTTLDQDIKEV